jgi:ribosomal protein S25
MGKQRKGATILKPVIDEETALRFASAGSEKSVEAANSKLSEAVSKESASPKRSRGGIEKDSRQILLTIDKDLYSKIAEEAARKNRTVEEHLEKHLIKRYQK